MTRKLLTILAGLALLVGLGISAKAQDVDPAYYLTTYDPVSGTNPGLGTALNNAYATVNVVDPSGSTTYYAVTVTAGGGTYNWDLAADSNGNVFFFDDPGSTPASCASLDITSLEVNGSSAGSGWGCTDTPSPVAGTAGTFDIAITAPANAPAIETLSFDYTPQPGATLGTSFAAYVADWPPSSGPYGYACTPPPSHVPEPGTLTLFGTGLLSIAGLLRRRLWV